MSYRISVAVKAKRCSNVTVLSNNALHKKLSTRYTEPERTFVSLSFCFSPPVFSLGLVWLASPIKIC